MRYELLAKPKFLVPLMILLWLVASLPLSVSQADAVTDPVCDTQNPTEGVWGQGDSPAHLTVQNACHQVSGTLVWGEWWRDKPQDCDRSSPEAAYATCSDSDKNWYMRLNRHNQAATDVTSGEIKKIQRWSQCKAGEKNPLKWCNFLTETIPVSGNYGNYGVPGDPTDDISQLPDPCLDKDWGGRPITVPPCNGKDIRIKFTGPLVKDNNHGWKEVHPVRKQKWTDSTGPHTCALDRNEQISCT
jgi:hypothetical protein